MVVASFQQSLDSNLLSTPFEPLSNNTFNTDPIKPKRLSKRLNSLSAHPISKRVSMTDLRQPSLQQRANNKPSVSFKEQEDIIPNPINTEADSRTWFSEVELALMSDSAKMAVELSDHPKQNEAALPKADLDQHQHQQILEPLPNSDHRGLEKLFNPERNTQAEGYRQALLQAVNKGQLLKRANRKLNEANQKRALQQALIDEQEAEYTNRSVHFPDINIIKSSDSSRAVLDIIHPYEKEDLWRTAQEYQDSKYDKAKLIQFAKDHPELAQEQDKLGLITYRGLEKSFNPDRVSRNQLYVTAILKSKAEDSQLPLAFLLVNVFNQRVAREQAELDHLDSLA